MKVTGIIAEFNPFHNGHKYLIQEAKKKTNADFIVVLMSGSFTQNGNVAIYDKFKRAKAAIEEGIDLVIELPTLYSVSSGEYFATGAIDLLNKLNIIDYVFFGSESGDINDISDIAKIELINKEQILKLTKEEMKKGITYAKAHENALKSYLTPSQVKELQKPNNILAIEYLKALKKTNSKIIPYTVKRKGNSISDTNIEKEENFTSATSIREYIMLKKDLKILEKYVPDSMYEIMLTQKPLLNDDIYNIIKFSILNNMKNIQNLQGINGISEGIENKIISALSISRSYDEFIHNIKSKRYTLSSIKRMILNILLNITKNDFNKLYLNINYAHILSMSANGKVLLSSLSRISNVNLLTKISPKVLNLLNETDKQSLDIDIFASNILSILLNENINKDYTNKL